MKTHIQKSHKQVKWEHWKEGDMGDVWWDVFKDCKWIRVTFTDPPGTLFFLNVVLC